MSDTKQKILVVEDEMTLRETLAYNLKREGYEVVATGDGGEALELAREHEFDLIVLDVMLPTLDGLSIVRILRKEQRTPIILLTARSGEVDRIMGLETGADDYVVKPFSVRELMARIKNVLRRATPQPITETGRLQIEALTMDVARHEARLGQATLELTALEFTMLHTLARHADQVLTREQLLEQVWGYDYRDDLRVVDAVIKRLRLKLRQALPTADLIVTVRGVGYKLASSQDSAEA